MKQLFIQFSTCGNELLSTSKIIVFLANLLWKLRETQLPNVISYLLYTYLSLSLFFTILVAPNKQFLNSKLLMEFLGQAAK